MGLALFNNQFLSPRKRTGKIFFTVQMERGFYGPREGVWTPPRHALNLYGPDDIFKKNTLYAISGSFLSKSLRNPGGCWVVIQLWHCETLELQWDTMPAVMRLAITPPPSVSPFTLRIWACSVCLSVLGLRWSGVCGRGLSLHISTVPFTVPRTAAQQVRMKWVYLSKKVFLG